MMVVVQTTADLFTTARYPSTLYLDDRIYALS
jgi:hypothetical protein